MCTFTCQKKIRWQDKIPDTEVLIVSRAGLPTFTTFIHKAQIRWAGYIARMPDHRIPKQMLFRELCHGKRSVGGQRKRFKDNLKVSLKDLSIDTEQWESEKCGVDSYKGAQSAEERRSTTQTAIKKRVARTARASSTQSAPTIHWCPTCGIGLTSHLRVHRKSTAN